MAVVSLGDVTFGLGADTKGLNLAITQLNTFGKKIDSIARKQSEGANKAVSTMAKQEAAVRKALQQVLRLNQSIRAAGGPDAAAGIARNTAAFRSFTAGMTQTNLTLKDTLRLQDRFQGQMGKSSRVLRAFKTDKARKGLKGMSNMMRDLESASVLAVGPLSGIGARIRALGAIANRSTLLIVGLLAGITGLSVAIFKLASAAIRARKEMDRIMAVLRAATGNAFFARKEFEFVAEVADKMGQRVADTAKSFANFAAAARGTALEGQGVRDVFVGVMEAVTALKLPLETQTGLFRALTQMMSKGVIQSEELRGQFGERLAGGFELVRKKIGKTRTEFAKMLKTGQLFAEKFVPAIGEALTEAFGKDALKSANTLENAINRLTNAQLDFNLAMDDMINASSIAIGVVNKLTSVIKVLSTDLDVTASALGAVTIGFLTLFGPATLKGIFALGRGIKTLTLFLTGLAVAAAVNPLFALGALIGRIIIGVGAATGAFFIFKSLLSDTNEETRKLVAQNEELLKVTRLQTDLQLDQATKQLEQTKAKIIAVEALIIAQRALVDSLALGVGSEIVAETTIGRDFQESLDLLPKLRDEMDRLIALINKGVEKVGGFGDEISDAMEDAIEEVEDLALALERANQQIENIGKDVALDPAFLDAFFEAQDILEELSTKELEDLKKKLDEVGFSSKNIAIMAAQLESLGISSKGVTTTVAALAQLVFASQQAEDQWKDMLKAFEKSPAIMKDLNEQFSRMQREIEAMAQGVDAVNKLNEAFDREDAIAKYAEQLAKMTAEARKLVPTLDEFAAKLDELNNRRVVFEKLEEAVESIKDVFESSFRSIGDFISEGIAKGELTMKGFIEVLEDIGTRILDLVIELLIIKPIMEEIGKVLEGGGFDLGALFGNAATDAAGAAGGAAADAVGVGAEAAEAAAQSAAMVALTASITALTTTITAATATLSASFTTLTAALIPIGPQFITMSAVLTTAVAALIEFTAAVTTAAITSSATAGLSKGGVLSGGRIRAFARGTVLNGPTIFPMANGDIGLAGEAGTEGVLPLTRTPSGDLGVKTDGGMSKHITINLNLPKGTDGRTFNESRNQIRRTLMSIGQTAAASIG